MSPRQPFIVTIQVLLDLPEKSEVILYTGLSALQKKYYKAILTKDLGMYSALSAHYLLLFTLSGLSLVLVLQFACRIIHKSGGKLYYTKHNSKDKNGGGLERGYSGFASVCFPIHIYR